MTQSILFLPGMMCDGRLYGPQLEALGSCDYRIGDLGGYESMSDIAAEVLADAPATFALVGLSMGGIVAMELMRQAPERITHLLLISTNPFSEAPEVAQRRIGQMQAASSGALCRLMREEIIPNYLPERLSSSSPHTKEEIEDICHRMAMDLGQAVFKRQSRALMHRPDYSPDLPKYDLPCKILCGDQDRLCPVSRHRYLVDQIPAAQLTILEGVGHLPTLEAPSEVFEAIESLLGL
ncbi:MAG: alpha/beta hydrolase [Ectothiorhodospiraceae bacterium AqS1]|nr:alpha/beta hydrolase [Ectothiorhodospiraceae bacterium AqS1]